MKYLLIALLMICGTAQAKCPTAPGETRDKCLCFEALPATDPSERSCEKDDECVVHEDGCGGYVNLNVAGLEKYKASYSPPKFKAKLDSSKFVPVCLNKSCGRKRK